MIIDQKPPEVVVDRSELQAAIWPLRELLDDPDTTVREAAQKVCDALAWPLLFDDSAWRLAPFVLQWPQAVEVLVDEALVGLPREVKDANPLWVALARKFAKLADSNGFGTDCRLEFLGEVYQALDRLKDAEGVDDGSD